MCPEIVRPTGTNWEGQAQPEAIVRLIFQAFREINAFAPPLYLKGFAPGWTTAKVAERIYHICHFAVFNSDLVISLDRRRRISRLASDLLSVEDGSTEAPSEYLDDLRDLAGRQPGWRTVPNVSGGNRLAGKLTAQLAKIEAPGGLSAEFHETLRTRAASERQRFTTLRNWGGNRRSGERSLKSSVLGMIVLLYCEAHARPGGAENGPLFRFANAVGELALGERQQFTPGAVRAEFRRMKPKVRRLPSLRALYREIPSEKP